LLWVKGIAKVVDMRSTDKIFGYLSKALARKIEAQKLLIKDLTNLSYADVQIRFEDKGTRHSLLKHKNAAKARAPTEEDGAHAARGLLMGPFGRQTICKEVKVLNYINDVNQQRAAYAHEDEKDQPKLTRR
jgi:hypothetical protein